MKRFDAEAWLRHNHPLRLMAGRGMLEHPSFEMHTHDCCELVVIIGGRGIHRIEQMEFPTRAGDIFMIHEDEQHGFEQSSGLDMYNLAFDRALLRDATAELGPLPGFQALMHVEPRYRRAHSFESKLHLTPRQLVEVRGRIEAMLREQTERSPGFRTQMQTSFMQLLVQLSRIYPQSQVPQTENVMRLSRVIGHMHEAFAGPLRVADLARRASMSESSFHRAFRECFQCSPMEYVLQLRIRRACDLMLLPGKSLTEIAYETGFESSSYFSRKFRERQGLSPRAWRAKFGGG